MSLSRFIVVFLIIISSFSSLHASDTLIVGAKDINTKVLIPGVHRWLVYWKLAPDKPRSYVNIWTRKIEHIRFADRNAISITQEWEWQDTIGHTVFSVCDENDFSCMYQKAWTKQTGIWEFDFINKTMRVNDKVIESTDTTVAFSSKRKAFDTALSQYTLNWHLDLEVFPLLPYKTGLTFGINYYDPGFSGPKMVFYTVEGSSVIKGYDGQEVSCWILVHLDPSNKSNRQVFYISKKTKEVVKLEQVSANRLRYKIMLPFSG